MNKDVAFNPSSKGFRIGAICRDDKVGANISVEAADAKGLVLGAKLSLMDQSEKNSVGVNFVD